MIDKDYLEAERINREIWAKYDSHFPLGIEIIVGALRKCRQNALDEVIAAVQALKEKQP